MNLIAIEDNHYVETVSADTRYLMHIDWFRNRNASAITMRVRLFNTVSYLTHELLTPLS